MGRSVLVVGGPADFVYGNLSRKLAEHDIEVGWHASDFDGEGSPFTGIPTDCDGVIILIDMVNHPLHNKVAAAAKKAEVILGRVPRKWSIAEGLLRAQGLLDPAENGLKNGGVSRTTIKETALAYIIEERRCGRNPKKGEVEAAVKRAHGPSVKLYKDEYSRAKRMAASQTPLIKPARELPPVDMAKEIRDWAMFMIEEDPSLAHDPRGLIKLVSQQTEIRYGRAQSLIEDIANETLLRWTRKDPEDRAFRDRLIVGWLRRWFQRWKKLGQDYPDSRTVDNRCRQIFGVRPSREAVKEARAQAIGEWARDLVYAKNAQDYANRRWPDMELDVADLLKRGLLKSVPTGKMPMTSELAVDELVSGVKAGTLSLAQAPPPAPEPVPPPDPEVEIIGSLEIKGAPEPVPLPVQPSQIPSTSEEDMLTLASIVEEAVTQKLLELLSPIAARLEAIEKKLNETPSGGQVDMEAFLDRVLNGSEVTGITVSIDPISLRLRGKQGG